MAKSKNCIIAVQKILNNDKYNDCLIQIHPIIEMFHENGGSIIIEEKLWNTLQIKFKKYKKTDNIITSYTFRDLELTIDKQDNRSYIIKNQLKVVINKELVIVSKIEYIPQEKFPILDKYHKSSIQDISSYIFNLINISFIKDNNDNHYILINFINNNNGEIIKKFRNGVIHNS